jgi:hypothetical protein
MDSTDRTDARPTSAASTTGNPGNAAAYFSRDSVSTIGLTTLIRYLPQSSPAVQRTHASSAPFTAEPMLEPRIGSRARMPLMTLNEPPGRTA